MSTPITAQSGLEIMMRRGEAAGRQWLIEHAHKEAGPNTAARTGTLILDDGSSVAITETHYAFRWTSDGNEFAMSYATSEETTDWPELGEPLSHAPLAAITATILLGRYEDHRREALGLRERNADDPRLELREAARAAPSLTDAAESLVNGEQDDGWLTSIRDQFLEECADRAADRLPRAEQEALISATDRALNVA